MMVRRKGELSKYGIDHGWPHQVALPALATCGENFPAVQAFCEHLSLAPRGHGFVRDGRHYNVWCFALKDDAEKSRERFGGEFMRPQDRPRWPGK